MEPVSSQRTDLLDALERIGTTIVQAVIVYVLAAQQIDGTFWRGLLVTLIIGVASGVKVLATTWVPVIESWWWDTVYRVASTFVVAVAGQFAAVEVLDVITMSWAENVLAAAAMSALVVLKAAVARRRPPGITPASLITSRGDLAA